MKTPPVQRAAGRKALAAKGQTLPGTTSFPTPNVAYWHKALQSVGRVPAGKRPALARYLKKRAGQLGIPGHVKGTWLEKSPATAMANNDSEAISLATTMTRKMPAVRGAADVQLSRTAPGQITAMHKSSGMKIGMIAPQGNGYAGTHADGTGTGASGSQQGALAGLIAYHNKKAAGFPAAQQGGTAVMPGAKTYTAGTSAVDLAGSLPVSTPASSATDGPKVTSMGAGAGSSGAAGLSPYAVALYKKFLAKKMKPNVALAFAKRADAMHLKAAGPKASAA